MRLLAKSLAVECDGAVLEFRAATLDEAGEYLGLAREGKTAAAVEYILATLLTAWRGVLDEDGAEVPLPESHEGRAEVLRRFGWRRATQIENEVCRYVLTMSEEQRGN